MSIRSHAWVRTRTAVWAWTATLLVCPAASRAEQPAYAALNPNLANAFSALMETPTAANLEAVRGLLAADGSYDPYSDLTEFDKLLHEGKNQEAVALVVKSQPNLLLSPRAHRLAAEAAERLGDKTLAARETVFAARCVEGILATGDGSESRLFRVARPSDEADLLDAKFQTRIDRQGLIFRDGMKYDKVLGQDGNTYWFDVSLFFERTLTMPVQSPAAAAGGPTAPATQAAVARPATAPVPTQGPEGRATVPPADGVQTLIQVGRDAYRAGQNDVALAALDAAIARDPRNAGIHVDRGNLRYVQREYRQAIADFSAAIGLDAGCATAHSNRAFAWNALGEPDKAITDFNAAIRLQANFGRAYNGRGSRLSGQGHDRHGHRRFRRGDPPQPELRRGLREPRCGLCQEGEQDAGRCGRGQGESAPRIQSESHQPGRHGGQDRGQLRTG